MSDLKSPDQTATRPQTATVMTPQSPRARIARRTRGQSHGPITGLISPSDFGHLLKPFVFLDLFDTHGKPSLVVSASIRIPASQPYLEPEGIPNDGPAHVLLGSYGTATSAIKAPSPMSCLAVRLKAGERWRYQPPAEHTVLWAAVGMGSVLVPDEAAAGRAGRLQSFERRDRIRGQFDAELVLGSAIPHDCDLVLGAYSVHTSTEALREAEARISAIQTRLIQQGRR